MTDKDKRLLTIFEISVCLRTVTQQLLILTATSSFVSTNKYSCHRERYLLKLGQEYLIYFIMKPELPEKF